MNLTRRQKEALTYAFIGIVIFTLFKKLLRPHAEICGLSAVKYLTGNARQPFSPGIPKHSDASYSRVLVVSKTLREDTRWISKELPDFQTAIYETNNLTTSKYTTPANKGHEAMVYLTYIIDHYDELPEIMVFIHAHKQAWHNNFLLSNDTPTTLRRLRSDRIIRQGYMNLRCHHDPGCPMWLRLDIAAIDVDTTVKLEQGVFTQSLWHELFPTERIPPVLSQPAGAQFAVTAERVRDNPKSMYEHLRNWLLKTELPDFQSGRVFEYLWQYIFTRNAEFCPQQNYCYCDGYGICFGSHQKYQEFERKHGRMAKIQGGFARLNVSKSDIAPGGKFAEPHREMKALEKEVHALFWQAWFRGDDERFRRVERERSL
ncbi:hypothetical protein M011DRAFT_463273 [Sporormia fimetaria CBS 119925]|uniref:Uncharacterized protein n=1 Tax=Sporormia fimetaria CBS 119925 TaxID=1340428 RepID=A0A6A6VPI0_9PLEO|nr:hypothetical protein M011DRAFT_463273 [Sporormia fimetaria CBS 119925]